MTNKESSPVSELVERLRSTVGYSPYNIGYSLVSEAADRLTALEAEVARLRMVLVPFNDIAGEMFARGWDASNVALALDNPNDPLRVTAGDFFAVRAALSAPKGGEHE